MLIIEPVSFVDARGYFFEGWSERRYAEAGVPRRFVQDNVARSSRGTLRGLHLQAPPLCQGKLVSVLDGEVFDVAVDLRPNSPTFGQWLAETLSASNKKQVYLPPGFAHGYCVVSETALLMYKSSEYYAPHSEVALRWDDPDLAIAWPVTEPLLSSRDAAALALSELRKGLQSV